MSTCFYLHKKDTGRATVLATAHEFLDRLPDTKSWEIEITIFRKPRTEKQRKALFAAAYGPIMEHMGLRGNDDKEDLHAYFCGEYWGWHPQLKNKPIRTTTKNEQGVRDEISTTQALDFYAFIQQRAIENGIFVPDPDPFWRETAENEARKAA